MAIKPKNTLATVSSTFLFAAAGYLLGLGAVVFCCAPTHPGGGFWQPEKFFYGILPACASVALSAYAARLLAHACSRPRNAWLAGCAAAALALSLDIGLFVKWRGRLDEGIKLAWRSESSAFSWGYGEVRLPPGFTHTADLGIDTCVGHFTSQDGKLEIQYDIGELAGEHGRMGKPETLTEGSRVRIGRAAISDGKGGTLFFSKVSFPDSGCANFYLESAGERDAAAIEFIARSFRPKGWMPSWVRPLLPEVLRSDCRQRLKLPGL